MGKEDAFKQKGSKYDRSQSFRLTFYVIYAIFNGLTILSLVAAVPLILIGIIVPSTMGSVGAAGIVSAIIFCGCGIVYLVMTCTEWNRYTKVKIGKDISYAYNYCQKLKNTKCVMKMKINCYHYETKRSSNGKTRQVRVNTFSKTKKLKYKSWLDVSEFPNFNQTSSNLIHVFTEMEFEYADDKTRKKMEKKKKKFIEKYKKKDTHHSFHIYATVGNISSLDENDFTFAKDGNIPVYFTPIVFYTSIFTCWGVVYRVLFDQAFKSVKFRIKKKISRDKHALPCKTKDKYKLDFTDMQAYSTYQTGYINDAEDQFVNIQMVTDPSQMDWTFGNTQMQMQNQQMAIQNQQMQMQNQQMAMQNQQMQINPMQNQQMQMQNQQMQMQPMEGQMQPIEQQGGMIPTQMQPNQQFDQQNMI